MEREDGYVESKMVIDRIKRRAHDITKKKSEPSDIASSVIEELKLTLEQIEYIEKLYDKMLYSMLDTECKVDTEIMQLNDRLPRYSSRKYPEHEKLQRQLRAVETERRRFVERHSEDKRKLEDKLQSFLTKHKHLTSLKDAD